jgi:hypothetical protein
MTSGHSGWADRKWPISEEQGWCYPSDITLNESNMTSNELLMVAVEQLAQLEKHWYEDSNCESRRPLKITTHWYKPAMDDEGSSHVIAIRRKPIMSKIKKPKHRTSGDRNTDECNDMNKNNSASQMKTKPPTPKNRTSTTCLRHLKGTAHSCTRKTNTAIPTLGRSSSPRQRPPRREERGLAQDDTQTEPKIVFREVRWSEPPSDRRRSVTPANTSAKRQAKPRDEKHANHQPIRQDKKKKTIDKPPQNVFVSVPEPAGCEGVDLARRSPRPRSPSTVRPRLRSKVPVQLRSHEEVGRRENPPDIWKGHRRRQQSHQVRRPPTHARRTTTATVDREGTASTAPSFHQRREHATARPRHISTAPIHPRRTAEKHQRPSTLPSPHPPYQPVYGYDYRVIPAPAPNQHQYRHQYHHQTPLQPQRRSTKRLHTYSEPWRWPNEYLSQEDFVQRDTVLRALGVCSWAHTARAR